MQMRSALLAGCRAAGAPCWEYLLRASAAGGPRARRCLPRALLWALSAWRRCSTQSGAGLSARGRRKARSGAGAGPQRAPGPHLSPPRSLPSPTAAPDLAMGNVPSAVKHCLSYQQLLREHLWIGDSVAGAFEPAQVPPRGPGGPHPLSSSPRPPLPFSCSLSPWALPATVL